MSNFDDSLKVGDDVSGRIWGTVIDTEAAREPPPTSEHVLVRWKFGAQAAVSWEHPVSLGRNLPTCTCTSACKGLDCRRCRRDGLNACGLDGCG